MNKYLTRSSLQSTDPRQPQLQPFSPPCPQPLFPPTTLIVGDSIMRNIRFFNATTHCFPGATVTKIMNKLPDLLRTLPSSTEQVIIHVGTNDLARGQSELVKRDFNYLFGLLRNSGKP